MPGRQQRGGAKSAPRGTSTAKKTRAKTKKPASKGGKVTSYGREDHRHAPKDKPTSRKKLNRETTGVDEDLDYGAGTRGHRGTRYAPSPVN
jgi:hypothetical protein